MNSLVRPSTPLSISSRTYHAFPAANTVAHRELRSEFQYDDEAGLSKELTLQVRKVIGPFAAPKKIYIVGDLPKTRSGKIMRRILRKIVDRQEDQLGDLSTLAEPAVVEQIIVKVKETRK